MTANQVVFYAWIAFSLYWAIISYGRKKRSDKDRAIIIAVLCVVVALLSEKASAQTDHRWRLIQGTDSIVEVPLADLRIAGALRAAKNYDARRCAWELVKREQEVVELRDDIASRKSAAKIQQAVVASQTDEINYLTIRVTDSEKKANRKEPWATIGKVVVVAGGIKGGYELAKTFKFIQ